MSAARAPGAAASGARWHQRVQLRLGAAFLVAPALLGAAAWLAGQQLFTGNQNRRDFRYEEAISQRLAAETELAVRTAESLATAIATPARNHLPRETLKALLPQLAERTPRPALIAALGIWPEPATPESGLERSSIYFVREPGGSLKAREDYNDPRSIPYFREAWYTPARYAAQDRCFWTSAYRGILAKREIITCSLPLGDAANFAGVATVSLDLDELQKSFAAATADLHGYALLLDRDDHLLALSLQAQESLGSAIGVGRSIAELAQRRPDFNALALALNRRRQDFLAAAQSSPRYAAAAIATLQGASRDVSRAEAESALAAAWNAQDRRPPLADARLELRDDQPSGGAAYAVLHTLPGSGWQLLSVTAAVDGAGAGRDAWQPLAVALAAAALSLALAWSAVRASLIRPLQRMIAKLTAGETDLEPSATVLEESSTEVGRLAHWYNARTAELREELDEGRRLRAQLSAESAERQRAHDALARVQERASLALGSIDDGVVATDEQGLIDDLNPAAERLTGLALSSVRGRPFAEVVQLRAGGESSPALSELPLRALARGARLEVTAQATVIGPRGVATPVSLMALPMRSRAGRDLGCLVVLRESAQAPTLAALPAPERCAPLLDPTTGLGGRAACEQALRAVPERSRAAFLIVDLDQAVRVRERCGPAAGEALMQRAAEVLAAGLEDSARAFRLASGRFALLLSHCEPGRDAILSESLRERLAEAVFDCEGQRFGLAASIGLCIGESWRRPGEAAVEPLRRAGAAATAARRRGGNAVIAWTAVLEPASARTEEAAWARRIRRGLNEGLLHLTTQWIAPARRHDSEGEVYEILPALEDEEGFWMPAASFLPVAERHQLGAALDRWVLAQTLDLLETRAEARSRIALCCLDLGAASIADPELIEFLAGELGRRPQLEAAKLCFSMPDEILADAPRQAQVFCEAMRALGCRLAVEYRSDRLAGDLGLMRGLAADFLKFDGRTLRHLADDPIEHTLAETALRVAQHLERRLIVTGIDDAAGATVWRKLGADYLQGAALGKPSPLVFVAAAA